MSIWTAARVLEAGTTWSSLYLFRYVSSSINNIIKKHDDGA